MAIFMNKYPIQPCSLIQDNDPKHGSSLCADALAEKNITWVINEFQQKNEFFSVFFCNFR